jgi:hypothetical protein
MDDAARLARIVTARQQSLLRSQLPASRAYADVPNREFVAFGEEREWLVARLAARGFSDPVVVDLSKPGWPIAVVRVLVPGLRFEPNRASAERTGR